ncbi:MAG: glycosyltransferase family 39 protein [Ignavibacteriaceae bacterium]|nr:glycosyltransferase family 39 protein [Ignavibacteriaceae bacterium]
MLNLKTIIVMAFLLRAAAFVFTGGYNNDYYWEYGETAKNLMNGKGYSLFYYDGQHLEHHFNVDAKPYPSAYMSPGYAFFLYPFLTIKSLPIRNILLFLVQVFISLAVIILLFKVTKNIFNDKAALIAALIYAVTPDVVYAVVSYTPTVIYHLLVILLIYFLTGKKNLLINTFVISLIFTLTIYFRGEFLFFLMFYLGYLFTKKRMKEAAIILTVTVTLTLPWVIRNYFVFEKPLFSTGAGINLYRGNNKLEIGAWGDDEVFKKLKTFEGEHFEIKMNDFYTNEAVSFIKSNPAKFVTNIFRKFYSFWGITPDGKVVNSIFQFSWFLVLISFLYGVLKAYSWQKFKYYYMFFILSTVITLIFFPMPRYQTMMKILMFPFCGYAFSLLLMKFKTKN